MEKLIEGRSLEVRQKDELVFSSGGKWLYPLFELEDFLEKKNFCTEDLFLHDRIAGRAAAALICRMGFRRCFIDTVSEPALEVFRTNGVECGFRLQVPKILCKTESLINHAMALDEVYALLKKRAGLIQGQSLTVRDLYAGYGGRPVLQGVSLQMEAGERLVITGDNGTGKSTLLKTLIGTIKPISGSISVGDGNPGELPPVGYVDQNLPASSYPLTVEEVIQAGTLYRNISREERSHEVEIAMRRTGCFPLRKRNIYTLSGGERQRGALARCLSQRAGILLLDEPTSFLDHAAKEDFLKVLTRVARNQMPTVILVSHDHGWIEKLQWPIKELKEGQLC